MYENDYGFPVEGRVLATVIETTDRGFGFAQVEGTKMKLYLHVCGKRKVKKVDGVLEWHRLQQSDLVLPQVGDEIIFDLVKEYNEIQYWCPRPDFDEVYYLLRRKRMVSQLAFAGC